jgi:hypothetical protein
MEEIEIEYADLAAAEKSLAAQDMARLSGLARARPNRDREIYNKIAAARRVPGGVAKLAESYELSPQQINSICRKQKNRVISAEAAKDALRANHESELECQKVQNLRNRLEVDVDGPVLVPPSHALSLTVAEDLQRLKKILDDEVRRNAINAISPKQLCEWLSDRLGKVIRVLN